MKIYKKSILPMILIWFLLISETLGQVMSQNIAIFQYSDELVTVFMILYMLFAIIRKKISNQNIKLLILLMIICLIGIASNLFFNIQKSYYAIMLDIIAFTKVFICYIGFDTMLNKKSTKNIISSLVVPAKIILTLGLVFGIVSQVVDIGMRGAQRFGFWEFNFIFGYAHIYAVIIIFCVIVLSLDKKSSLRINKYLIMAVIEMIMTTKGPAIIWAFIIFMLLYYYRKHKKINTRLLVLLGSVCILLGGYQIQNYLLNENAPRSLFYKYGFIVTRKYMPLGSGFATFGSDMAAKFYSPLYREFGFNVLHGLTESDTSFLNDNYWPMISGQFGFIGLILAIAIVLMIFMRIQKIVMPRLNKAILFSSFFYIMLHSIGSSILTTSSGVILFISFILKFKIYENTKVLNR